MSRRILLLGTLLVLAGLAPSTNAQFATGKRPVCSSSLSAITMNCDNFEAQNGEMVFGWNYDFGKDTADTLVARMNSAGGASFSARKPAIYGIYTHLSGTGLDDADLLDNVLGQLKGRNAMFITTLDPISGYANVSEAGLALFADKIAQFNKFGIPVFIRPAHEMNGPWYAYGLQPAKFKAFFIKVYKAVKSKAPFVKFIFAPNDGTGYPWPGWDGLPAGMNAQDVAALDTNGNGKLDTGDDPYTPYYPGDAYVDWFGISLYWRGPWPYNVNTAYPAGFIASHLTRVFGAGYSSYEFASFRHLPIMFTEMAGLYTAANPGVSNLAIKRAFWEDAYGKSLRQSFPLLKMALWFDFNKWEENAQRDFSISSFSTPKLATDTIVTVAPSFNNFLATAGLLTSTNLSNTASTGPLTCGCFRNSASGTAFDPALYTTVATKTVSYSIPPPTHTPTKFDDWEFCVYSSQCLSGCCGDNGNMGLQCLPSGTAASLCLGTSSATSTAAAATQTGLGDWVFCSVSSQCANGCCSKEYSDDGLLKCTPGGSQCVSASSSSVATTRTTTTTRSTTTTTRSTTTTTRSTTTTTRSSTATSRSSTTTTRPTTTTRSSTTTTRPTTTTRSSTTTTRTSTTTTRSSTTTAATATNLADWQFCTSSTQCTVKCCSKEYSDDGLYKCTPGSSQCLA